MHFKDMSWRLSLVNGCRQRQKMLQPKFTFRLDTEQKPLKQAAADEPAKSMAKTMVFDMDCTNMQRLEEELKAAINSMENQYPKKVQKFIV